VTDQIHARVDGSQGAARAVGTPAPLLDPRVAAPRTKRATHTLDRSPALARHTQERARSLQNRLADRITAFAGSMAFVYIHLAWFGCWIGFRVEHYPYGLLTMIVSLEAIFLSTFVLISQNRADARRQVLVDEQWRTVQEEDRQNEQLLDLSRQTLELTKAIHAMAAAPQLTAEHWQSAPAASDAHPRKETT
jgi:uncharacterized membrane protein